VIVKDGEVKQLTDALDAINSKLGKPPGTVLHWAENVKEHSQRKVVARELAATPAVITNAIVMKQPLMGSGSGLSNATTMYNYAVRRLLERITWYLRDRGAEAIITFAHVPRFPYRRMKSYRSSSPASRPIFVGTRSGAPIPVSTSPTACARCRSLTWRLVPSARPSGPIATATTSRATYTRCCRASTSGAEVRSRRTA
jgi:hypothetical protein